MDVALSIKVQDLRNHVMSVDQAALRMPGAGASMVRHAVKWSSRELAEIERLHGPLQESSVGYSAIYAAEWIRQRAEGVE